MKILLFGGTSEGRELSEYLDEKKIETVVSVTTDYGKELLPDSDCISVIRGRLEEEDMEKLFFDFDLVIDATHPYAGIVTENIKKAASKTGVRCLRLKREDSERTAAILKECEGVFNSVEEAAEYLKNTEGRIFVSTGSKELDKYTVIPGYKDRVVARLLPIEEAYEKAESLGIKKTIFGKGPFSYEENLEQFKSYGIKYLVTKISGKAGGFEDKAKAAKDLKIKLLLIGRKEEEGLSLKEIKEVIGNEYR